jgi:hypothetical protein
LTLVLKGRKRNSYFLFSDDILIKPFQVLPTAKLKFI